MTTLTAPSTTTGRSALQHFVSNNALVLVLYGFLAAALIGLSIYSPTFRSSTNLLGLARQAAIPGIIGIAQTLIILSGGIDLSVAGLVTFISLVSAGLVDNQPDRYLPVAVLMLAVGLAVGAFNGLIVTRGRVPPFITTLGTALLLQGGGLAYTTVPKGGIPSDVAEVLYYGQLGPLPHSVILLLAVFVAAWFLLTRTAFGRNIYAVGGSAEVARRAGIMVNRTRMGVYCLGSFLVAIAALVATARMGIGDPLAGMGMELDSINAVVMGGTSLFGGRGNLFGTLAGVVIVTLIANVMVILGVSMWYQQLIKGMVVLMVVAIYKQRA